MIRVAVEAGVKAAVSEPQVTESVVQVTGDDGTTTKTTRVTTTKRRVKP